jgi:hypothetical protein
MGNMTNTYKILVNKSVQNIGKDGDIKMNPPETGWDS